MIDIKTSFVGFHGTQELFASFKTPVWFSNTFEYADNFASHWGQIGARTDASRVIIAVIELANPYHTNDWAVTEPQNKDILKEIEEAGYDGVVFTAPENDQEIEYIVFRSDQIKQLKSVSVATMCDKLPIHDADYSRKLGM